MSDDNTAYQFTYNADGEETSQADVGSPELPTVTLTYEYDADGDRTSMDDSLGGLVSYAYDARDELTNETLSGSGISAMAVANTYDNAGNMTGQTRYSNLAETDVVATTSFTYDDANQMTGITDKNSGGTTLVSYGYTYDAAGLVSQETRTWDSGADTDTLDYTYTNNDQLTGVTHTNDSFANESFSYDSNGNQTGTGYTTSTGNEQTASPGFAYTYDADGNMITETNTSTGDVWTYSYNFRGLMTGAVEKTSGGTVLAQVTYTYDALDNRIGMDENGTQTWTLYDGSNPIMDFNSSGSLEMRYLNGPIGDLVDTIIARESAGGTIAWYLPDRLGTIRDLINNSGSIIDHVDYSAFGTVLDESSPSNGDRMMGFAGMERDTVTGMNLAVNRMQNPGTGRWTSQDPLGFAAGDADLYRYVGSDPAGMIDPSGLAPGKGTVTTISQGVLDKLKKQGGAKFPLEKFPGGFETEGPCAAYAQAMAKALKDAKIKFNLIYYNVTQGSLIDYMPPKGGPIEVTIRATKHVIVQVEVESNGQVETILLDAGVGVLGGLNNGNLGDIGTGVIAPKNQHPKDKNTGQEILSWCGASDENGNPVDKNGNPILKKP